MIINSQTDKDRAINRINLLIIDKPWQITIKPYKKDRSGAQNKLHWLRLNFLEANGPGYTADEWHVIFSNMFLEPVTVRYKDEIIEVRKSTSKLTTNEFNNFLEKIDRWSVNELGIVLPAPEDLYYEAMGIKKHYLEK